MWVTSGILLIIASTAIFLVNANPMLYNRALHDDLEDFLTLVPKAKVLSIFHEYLEYDEEVQYIVRYIQTSEFQKLVETIESIPDVVSFYRYLQESGLDVYYLINKLHDIVGLPPFSPLKKSQMKITGGVSGLIVDIKGLLPVNDIEALYYEKLETSEDFKKMIEHLQSPKFQAVIDTLLANAEFQEIIKKAEAVGVDIKAITDLLSTIFGLKFPEHKMIRMPPGLHDDLEDFLALIPVDEVLNIFFEYVEQDEEVQYAIEYVQSSRFRELVKVMESIRDVIPIYKYLQDSGLDIHFLVNNSQDFIDLPPLITRIASHQITGGVAGLITDIKTALPIEDIKVLYEKKLDTSEEFRKLIECLQSQTFQADYDMLLANSDFQAIVGKVKAIDIDMKAITDLISTILGLEFPINLRMISYTTYFDFGEFMSSFPMVKIREIFNQHSNNDHNMKKLIRYFRTEGFKKSISSIDHSFMLSHLEMAGGSQVTVHSLKDDVYDFILLIPVDEIAKITIRYILNDAQVQEAIQYIESQELENLVIKLQNDDEVYELLKYFVDSGADIIGVINMLNEFLDYPPYQFPRKIIRHNAVSNGVQSMLDEIRTILPYDQIEIMYNKKLEESQDFRFFVERIEDPAFQKIIDKIVINKNVLELGYQAELHGINIDAIAKFLSEVFGLNLPDPPYFPPGSFHPKRARSLSNDLNDFYDLLPVEHIVELAVEYILEDEEMRLVFAYIHSQSLKNIINALHDIPEYRQILMELAAQGVDVNSVIAKLQEIIGLRNVHSSLLRGRIEKPGLIGLIESVKELLPYEEIKALYKEKMKTSEPFSQFVALIRSEKFQSLTYKLFANEDFKSLINEAEHHGVNLKAISDFFLHVFGIETPPGIISYYH